MIGELGRGRGREVKRKGGEEERRRRGREVNRKGGEDKGGK